MVKHPDEKPTKALIFGAGLVGSLLGIYLAKQGLQVEIHERRPDFRLTGKPEGRSINLALSERAWNALRHIGLEDEIRNTGLPMQGRMMHDLAGNTSFQPYGTDGQSIFSVSRGALNVKLMEVALAQPGLSIRFNSKCVDANFEKTTAMVQHLTGTETLAADFIFATDGAYSAIRNAMLKTERFNYEQNYIEHGYKEFTIPADASGNFQLPPNSLHIWPRGHFMMIALPNPDGTFTCTLFFPYKGNPSFAEIETVSDAEKLFAHYFPDFLALAPTAPSDFFQNPTGALVTVKCYPWLRNKTLLLGDAAHAIVPFFGQGMNAGFEDVFILDKLATEANGNFGEILDQFQQLRKPDADAIAELALNNFVEMRDKVADPAFLFRKKLEAKIAALFPNRWIPLYSQVSFMQVPYSEALANGIRQEKVMNELLALDGLAENWDKEGFLKETLPYFLEKL